ncbi:MAG: hypothetical protein QE487_14645 [Fluviicola sp.]|nr:hypothetical protein [Fluviicola sp.]
MNYFKRIHILRILFILISISVRQQAFCQPDYSSIYKPSVFPSDRLEKVHLLEQLGDTSIKVKTPFNIIDSSIEELLVSCSNEELYMLANHPNEHIRHLFVDKFGYQCKNQDSLYNYLKATIYDTTVLVYFDNCTTNRDEFGQIAYYSISRRLEPARKRELQELILFDNKPSYLIDPVLYEIPKTPENYALFRSLVIDHKLLKALDFLLRYGDTNDRILIPQFTSVDRKKCHELMELYPHSSKTTYLDTSLSIALKNEWTLEEYNGFCKLINFMDSAGQTEYYDQITSSLDRQQAYRIASSIYYSDYFFNSSTDKKAQLTLQLLPSLYHIDSIDLDFAWSSNPELFESGVLQRLKNDRDAFDTETASQVFKRFMTRPTTEKIAVCLSVCKNSNGAELIESIAALHSTHQGQLASILVERYQKEKSVKVNSKLTIILAAIAYINDTLTNDKLANELVQNLVKCEEILDPFVYLEIIKSSNKPELIDVLLTNIEENELNRCSIDVIRFLLEFRNPNYQQRLLRRYNQFSLIMTDEDYYFYKFKEYLIYYGLIAP